MTPRDLAYRDGQGESLGSRPDPITIPDSHTQSCCPSDTKYETGPVKGQKRRVEDGDPEVLLKGAVGRPGRLAREQGLQRSRRKPELRLKQQHRGHGARART